MSAGRTWYCQVCGEADGDNWEKCCDCNDHRNDGRTTTMSDSEAVEQRIAELEHGANLLRDHPDSIDHAALAILVADWIDAEALMWAASQRLVTLMNAVTAEVSGNRAGKVHIGEIDGKPKCVIDTSTHADRIIAAANRSQP